MNYEKPQGTSSLSSLNLDLSFGGSKTMPTTQSKPAGFGMGQTAPPIVPGRPYDWTIKPGKRKFEHIFQGYCSHLEKFLKP